MEGASGRHVTISGNVFAALDDALEGTPCRAYMADMTVQAAEDEAYFYPDVLVTCDPADHRADQFMRAPTLIVEVLSPATAAYDRRATPPAVVAFQARSGQRRSRRQAAGCSPSRGQ